VLVSLADKLDNARAILRDFRAQAGELRNVIDALEQAIKRQNV
jgi:hypothetical protein